MTIEKELIVQYRQNMDIYQGLKADVTDIIQRLLKTNQIRLANFQIRIKKEEALRKKILYKQKYQDISDINDVVACRLITLFESDLDVLVELLYQNFDVVEFIDKRKKNNESHIEFGYNSLHLVVKFTDQRCQLIEYEQYKGLCFEIQIRTLLQHSWAEIEHGLGYKSQYEIPKDIRRRLDRLSANLEIIDEEFVNIEKDIHEYNQSLNKREKVLKTDVNKTSLINYALSSNVFTELVNEMGIKYGLTINFDPEVISQLRLVHRFHYLGYLFVQDLEDFIDEHQSTIIHLANEWCRYIAKDNTEINYYVCLLWVSLVMMLQSGQGDPDEILTRDLVERIKQSEIPILN